MNIVAQLWPDIAGHSFRRLPYDRPVASSKASSPQGAIWCFLFQFPVSSHFLKDVQ
jgi:hypothetical protein